MDIVSLLEELVNRLMSAEDSFLGIRMILTAAGFGKWPGIW